MKKFFARLKDYSGLIVVLILLCVIFQAQNQRFLTFDNIIGVMRQLSVYGIVGIGMGFLILNGYLDLTVGSIVGLCGVTVGMLMTRLDMSMWVAMLLTVLVGGIIGLFNGAVITATGIPAFIFTLSMTGVYRGIIYLITKGATINKFEDDFLAIGRSSFLGVPIPIYIFIAVLLIAWVILSKTTFGRSVYDLLPIRGNPNHDHTVVYDTHNHCAEQYANNGSLTAVKAHTANDCH